MKFALPALVAALGAISTASAQNMTNGTMDGAAGLISALQAANLTTLLSIAQANAATILPLLLSGEPLTVFAPTNEAFAQLPENVTSNDELVLNTVLYHAYYGNYNGSTLTSNNTIARSVQNSTEYANLPGGQGQVAVLTRGQSNDSVTVVQALQNVTSVQSTRYMNIDIHVIPTVLSLPMTVSETATAAGLTELVGALTSAAPEAVPAIDGAMGITVFAPVNQAFQDAQSVIATLNTSQVAGVLLNHIINGTAVYSTQITPDLTAVSAGGAPLSFSSNATGVFVMSGNVSMARIIRADIPVVGGVVHLIDAVLANTESNPEAAASAASSAAEAGATMTAPMTGAVGGGASATGSAGAPGSSAPASSGEKLAVGGLLGGAMAIAALVL